jgi:hypothetical protein
LDAECGVHVWDDVILVLGVEGLVLRREEDLVGLEGPGARELFKEVGVGREVEVEICAGRVAGLVVRLVGC